MNHLIQRTMLGALSAATVGYLLFSVGSTSAMGAEDRRAQLLELETLLDTAGTLAYFRERCLAQVKDINPEVLVRDHPAMFGGITPESSYWPRIAAAFKTYMDTSCGHPSEKDAVEHHLGSIDRSLSDEALDEVMKFYRSDAGRAHAKALIVARETLQEFIMTSWSAAMKRATTTYSETIEQIQREYLEDVREREGEPSARLDKREDSGS